MFHRKLKIVLGVTGSIAAYKAAELARLLVKAGHEVWPVMTRSAAEFITARTLSTLTGRKVVDDLWESSVNGAIEHIEVADWADLVLVAPATADIIAKYRAGFADSALLAVLLASKAKVIFAPAMNVNMLKAAATIENIEILKMRGVTFVDPGVGELACGWIGAGRLAELSDILSLVERHGAAQDLNRKRILITAGPTREALDPVRYLTNHSSGKMGVALANAACVRGADVTLIHGPIAVPVPTGVRAIQVSSANEMYLATTQEYSQNNYDLVIMAAAVADYRPEQIQSTKIKKGNENLALNLVRNPDILQELCKQRGSDKRPFIIGFAVETGSVDQLLSEARRKLEYKGADMIVANLGQEAFDQDSSRVWLVDRSENPNPVGPNSKTELAVEIIEYWLRTTT